MDEKDNGSPQDSAEISLATADKTQPFQFGLTNIFCALLIVALICGWTMDHRKLSRQLRADSAFLQPRRNELAQRLMADGRGRPLTDFPELGFLANHIREVDDDLAGRLRAAHAPARKTCTAYSVDFRRGPDVDYEEGDVYAIIVYAVDNTIVSVEEIDNDL